MRHLLIILCVLTLGCAVSSQQKGIQDARMVVGVGFMAEKAADDVIADVYGDKPAEDTDSYCKVKIAAVILTQIDLALKGAAEAIRLWEDALIVYLARKEAGENATIEWGKVLSSESAWMTLAADVAGMLEYLRRTLTFWIPDKIPEFVNYAWKMVSAFSGLQVNDWEWDWKTLEGSVCLEYLPGGGG